MKIFELNTMRYLGPEKGGKWSMIRMWQFDWLIVSIYWRSKQFYDDTQALKMLFCFSDPIIDQKRSPWYFVAKFVQNTVKKQEFLIQTTVYDIFHSFIRTWSFCLLFNVLTYAQLDFPVKLVLKVAHGWFSTIFLAMLSIII